MTIYVHIYRRPGVSGEATFFSIFLRNCYVSYFSYRPLFNPEQIPICICRTQCDFHGIFCLFCLYLQYFAAGIIPGSKHELYRTSPRLSVSSTQHFCSFSSVLFARSVFIFARLRWGARGEAAQFARHGVLVFLHILWDQMLKKKTMEDQIPWTPVSVIEDWKEPT